MQDWDPGMSVCSSVVSTLAEVEAVLGMVLDVTENWTNDAKYYRAEVGVSQLRACRQLA